MGCGLRASANCERQRLADCHYCPVPACCGLHWWTQPRGRLMHNWTRVALTLCSKTMTSDGNEWKKRAERQGLCANERRRVVPSGTWPICASLRITQYLTVESRRPPFFLCLSTSLGLLRRWRVSLLKPGFIIELVITGPGPSQLPWSTPHCLCTVHPPSGGTLCSHEFISDYAAMLGSPRWPEMCSPARPLASKETLGFYRVRPRIPNRSRSMQFPHY